MKKSCIILIGLWIILLQSTGYAQDKNNNAEVKERRTNSSDARKKVILGFKAGYNRTNVYDTHGQAFVAKPKTGGVAGLFVAIPFGSFIGFQPELLLSQKGFKGVGILQNESYSLTRTTTYLDIPLQLQLKPFGFLSMVGGIQYSYLLKQRDELSTGSAHEQVVAEFNNDNIRKNMVGGVIGVDVNFWHVVLSGRAGWDVISNHGNGTASTPRYKNTWLQATIGYRVY